MTIPRHKNMREAGIWLDQHRGEMVETLIRVAKGKPDPVGFLVRQFTDVELQYLLIQQGAAKWEGESND